MEFSLRKLLPSDELPFYEAYREFKEAGDFDFVSHYIEGMEFSALLSILQEQEEGRNLPEGFVPSTYLFGFAGPKLVGRLMIRHHLNEFLRNVGGHIGYGVVPSERNKGYATKMLLESLAIARELGLERLLLTCDEGNFYSQKIIEKAGGLFAGTSHYMEGVPPKRLYWVTCT